MKLRLTPYRLGLTILVASALPASALAQQGFERPTTLPSYGRDPVGARDSTVVASNPALLGFVPGAELRWTSQFLDERSRMPTQGHAIGMAIPIPFLDMGLGARFDFVDPPDGAQMSKYNVLSLGLGFKTSATSGLGVSYQHYYSEATQLSGLGSWSLGWTARPWNALGVGVVGKAINSPTTTHFGRLDPAWDFAMSLRPFGTDAVELGLVAGYVFPADSSDYFVPRGTLGIRTPYGHLRGELALLERGERHDWVLGTSFSVDMNYSGGSSSAALSSLIGSGLGHDSKYQVGRNMGFELAVRRNRESSGPNVGEFGVLFKIDDTPSARKHVALLRKLWQLAEREPAVRAVVFELRASPAEGTARAQELRDAIAYLKEHGKKVVCHVDHAASNALYVCSAADRILIHPGGAIKASGFASTHFYLKGLLDKLGVRADIVRIGDHKSAPEMFTREGPTDVAREDKETLMRQVESQWLDGVAQGRKIPREQLASRFAQGPFLSSDAKANGFVDDYAYIDEIPSKVGRVVGSPVRLEDAVAPRASNDFGAGRRVAVVYVDGDMVDGKSQTVPLIGMRLSGAVTLAETFRQLRADPRVGAVVLRVDSPGGSALAADTLWRELQLLAQRKPVICSMGSVAASGGYYIASATHRIFANPATITGSIGIFSGKADVSGLLEKIGVGVHTIKTAPNADASSPFRPYTEQERAALFREITQLYDMFLTRVSLGRKLSKSAIDAVGQGRVFTGDQALNNKLVDELGGLRQAIAYAERAAGLSPGAPIVELPPPDASLIEQLLGLDSEKAKSLEPVQAIIPPQLLEVAKVLSPFMIYEDDKPLTRLEGLSRAP